MNQPGEQLKMFMTPREIGGYVADYGDFGNNPGGLPHEAFQKLNDETSLEKDTNTIRSGMGESIAKEGVKKPLDIGHHPEYGGSILWNGHHRLQEQSFLDPDRHVPVVHTTPSEYTYHGRDSQGMRNAGLTYRTFNMNKSQLEDPTGDS